MSWDYWFLGARNRTTGAEVEQRGDSPVLVMHDGVTKSIFAQLIPAKGVDFPSCEKVVKMIIEDLETLVYHRVVFRCDNESSILALLRAVKLARTGDVVQETSAEGDPQSNGAAESSVNVVKGHVRSIKLAVESASGVEVPADHMQPGRDGKTAYERNVGMRAVPPWDSLVSECGGCLCSHPTAVWVLWIHDLNKEDTLGQWMDQTRCLLAPQVEW